MKTIDACGISCPEPLLMLEKALETERELNLLVDSRNALENCREYAVKKGYTVKVNVEKDQFNLHVAAAG